VLAKVKRYGSTVLIALTLISGLIITGSFYLVNSGTAVVDVIALLGAFGTMATAIITLLVKTDHQTGQIEHQGEELAQIRANTNHLLETAITDAVSGGVTEAAAGAARLRATEDEERNTR